VEGLRRSLFEAPVGVAEGGEWLLVRRVHSRGNIHGSLGLRSPIANRCWVIAGYWCWRIAACWCRRIVAYNRCDRRIIGLISWLWCINRLRRISWLRCISWLWCISWFRLVGGHIIMGSPG